MSALIEWPSGDELLHFFFNWREGEKFHFIPTKGIGGAWQFIVLISYLCLKVGTWGLKAGTNIHCKEVVE
jgi:hypothetical protein